MRTLGIALLIGAAFLLGSAFLFGEDESERARTGSAGNPLDPGAPIGGPAGTPFSGSPVQGAAASDRRGRQRQLIDAGALGNVNFSNLDQLR